MADLRGPWAIDKEAATESLFDYFGDGYTTLDMADHYGPAEDIYGEFRRRLRERQGDQAVDAVQAMTKWCPSPGPMNREVVEQAVGVSLKRMDVAAWTSCSFTGGTTTTLVTSTPWVTWPTCRPRAASATWP
ncbi:MAG: hypothetical protein CM1200mP2_54990 [Planctomycetaceae bacterium]|nr:MAG: hypothetical protein CM1200mP2_54990 [Planctomycetaceae bacterium]